MRRIFLVPAILFVASAAGLIVALIGDGAWNAAGWLGVGLPIAAIAWGWARRS